MAFRIALGLFCAMKHSYEFSTIFIVGLSIAFTMYVIINLPFNDVFQNYRTGMIQATTMYILLVADYYRTMKSNTPMTAKGRIYGPAMVELLLIAICIVVSCVVLIRELYQMIRHCMNSRSKKIRDESSHANGRANRSNAMLTFHT